MRLVPARPRIMVLTTIPETMAAFLVPQLRDLEARGFEVHVVSSPGAALDSLALGPGVFRHGVPIERRPHPMRDLASLARLLRLMRQVRPQIVHAHTPKAGLAGMAAAKLAGIPIRLYTVHGLPLLTRSGVRRRVLEMAEWASGALATRTYAVSYSVRELLVELGLCPASSVEVLGDGSCAGVDVDRFQPRGSSLSARYSLRARFSIPSEAQLVTFVGRLARDKGIAILARAWPAVAAEFPNAHLLLAGELDRSDPVPAEDIERLRAHETVRFAGTLTGADIPRVYAASDIAVLPTYREGLPQTALEAGASGIPMVASRVSGVVNAIEDGVTGLLVPAGEPGRLGDAVRLLLRDAELRCRLGAAARTRMVSRFSQQRVNQLWMSEYLRLVRAVLPDCADRPQSADMRPGSSDAY